MPQNLCVCLCSQVERSIIYNLQPLKSAPCVCTEMTESWRMCSVHCLVFASPEERVLLLPVCKHKRSTTALNVTDSIKGFRSPLKIWSIGTTVKHSNVPIVLFRMPLQAFSSNSTLTMCVQLPQMPVCGRTLCPYIPIQVWFDAKFKWYSRVNGQNLPN